MLAPEAIEACMAELDRKRTGVMCALLHGRASQETVSPVGRSGSTDAEPQSGLSARMLAHIRDGREAPNLALQFDRNA